MQYTVTLWRTASEEIEVAVEAASPEEAERLAYDKAKHAKDWRRHDWELDTNQTKVEEA